MSPGTNARIASVALGVLVLFFGSILGFVVIHVLARSLITHTDFVFSVSRRTFNIILFALGAFVVTAALCFARSLLRRPLN